MAKFTYIVTMTVPDEDQVPIEEILDFYGETDVYGFVQPLSPEQMAGVVLRERLGCDEDYGFDYSVDYEDYGTFLLRLTEQGKLGGVR